jgi:signal transduction histidine kinase
MEGVVLRAEVDQEFRISASRRLLENLIENLIQNAVGAHATTVSLRAGDHTLTIHDDGDGFDTATIAEGRSTTHGSGKTLAVVLPQLAALYGIGFDIESAHGRGTTVTLRFPREVPDAVGA